MSTKKDILLFDPDCPLCQKIKTLLEVLIQFKKIPLRFVPITNKNIYSQIAGINYWNCRQEVHLVTRDGLILKGDQVLDHILKQLAPQSLHVVLRTQRSKILIKLVHKELSRARKLLLKTTYHDCKACQN